MAENKESLKEKLRNLLSLNKGGQSKTPVSTNVKQSLICDEFWLDIHASSPLDVRKEKMKEAIRVVESEVVQDSIIKNLWMETKDLLQAQVPQEVRLFELSFIRSLIKGQYRRLGILRRVFFEALQEHAIPEDGPAVIQTFETLSENGKDIEPFEQEVGPLLLSWLKAMKGRVTLLSLLVNVIKFNSSYLDQEVVVQSLDFVCEMCRAQTPDEEKELGLQVVDAIICYSSLPTESLYSVTIMLCQTLNLKNFCSESWKLMRKLLGTHLGHSCVSTMCCVLQSPKMLSEWPILRSAVFFIGMGLWGSVRVKSLKHTPQSVLPSFRRALLTKNLELAFEVALTIQRLVRKFGHELQAGAWDCVFDIVSYLLDLLEEKSKYHVPAATSLQKATHEIITFIEKLLDSDVYDGPVERLFVITERCIGERPEESVFMLISHKMQGINPTKQNWVANLTLLLNNFYTSDPRPNIRLKTLEVLSSILEECMQLYEEELVSEVVTSIFSDLRLESDVVIKTKGIHLLVRACLLATSKCPELLLLLKNILESNWIERVMKTTNEDSFIDIEALVNGLVNIFKRKLYGYPGSHSLQVFHLIIKFLSRFYSLDNTNLHACLVKSRVNALKLLLSLRTNELGQLGVKEESSNKVLYSSYVMMENQARQGREDDGVSNFPIIKVLDCILMCLRKESCWTVLERIFEDVRGLLQNKYIIVWTSMSATAKSPSSNIMENLSTALCSLMSDGEITRRKIINLPAHRSKAGVQTCVLAVLSCLVSYHRWLGVARQRQILRCLESGFTSRCARLCVGSLTLCLVEMPRDTLLRVLPSVLLRLSQMSATVFLATTVLELLAMLAQLPGLYSNFVEEQYLSVFAVVLQYTNPSKFSRYVVSLAHYIIATWFAKCRMSFRPGFVNYITRNLHAVNRFGAQSDDDKKVDVIRNDLMETCIDVMARYTFSNCSLPPRRSPLAQFLFDKGPTATWLVGNKLVTITTSRCDKVTEKWDYPSIENRDVAIPPSRSSLDRQLSSEAPAKLQSMSFPSSSSSSRQRHKSGGSILKRSILSPFEKHTVNDHPVFSSTVKRLDLSDDASGEPHTPSAKHMLTQGWAEIFIRRPSGNTAWSMRIQNQLDPLDNGTIEDVLNLQSFVKEIKSREAIRKQMRDQCSSLNDSLEKSAAKPQNRSTSGHEYLDLSSDRRVRSVSNPDQMNSEGDCLESQGSMESAEPIQLSLPLPSSVPPFMRQRSRTLSTSKGCVAEAAATNARLAVERKKTELISKHGVSFTLTSDPVQTSSAADETTHRDGRSMNDNLQRHKSFGICSPSFIFLQLFQSAIRTESIHRPLLLPNTPGLERGIQVLDLIPAYDTWATGVIYVGPGNGSNCDAILASERGSPRYQELLQGLGELVNLTDCDPASTFLSGLDTSGEDGNYCYVWKDDISQMVFHITTLMPTRPDPGCKKKHIGNDYVLIAYDDDNGGYLPGCVVTGQFRSVEIIISPLDNATNHIRYMFHREEVERTMDLHTRSWLVSDHNLPVFVRQLALHANVASFVCVGATEQYSHKALARLRQIKRIRSRVLQETERDIANISPIGTPTPARRDNTVVTDGAFGLEEFSDFVR